METSPLVTDTSAACPAPEARPSGALARQVLPGALVLLALAALARIAALPLGNGDTFFHLRLGQEFLDGWSVRDPGSTTPFATAPWVPTQLLPELVMAKVDDVAGLAGLAWLEGLLFVILAVVVHTAVRRRSDALVAAPVLVLVLVASYNGLSMRPQVISYVLTALTVAAWLSVRETRRAPWWLVPLTWVWALCHGMWPIGIVLGLVACLGLRLDGVARGRTLVSLLAVPLLSLPAAALTPVGPGIYSAVLVVTGRRDSFSEWAAPSLVSVYGVALLLLLAAPVVVRLRTRTPSSWTDTLLLGLAVALAVWSTRTLPLAAVVAAPLAASALQQLLGSRTAPGRLERSVVAAGAVVPLAVLALVVPHTADRPEPSPTRTGIDLSALPAGTRVVNDLLDGGYLMWAHPSLDVFMHGYADTYTDAELAQVKAIEDADPGWDDLLRDTGATWAVLPVDTRLSYQLHLAGWEARQSVEGAELLEAPPGWGAR
jgi:hypothetical protein